MTSPSSTGVARIGVATLIVCAAAASGCDMIDSTTGLHTYESTRNVVLLSAGGWNDVVIDGRADAVVRADEDALVLNLPSTLEPGRAYPIYAGAPSLAPWSRPDDQIGVSWSDQIDGPSQARGTILVRGWQTSPGGVFVDLELRAVRLDEGGAGRGAPRQERVTFWAFRVGEGAPRPDTDGDLSPAMTRPAAD